ncbi:hypothetical protein F2P81_001146 [Scophthalmus maximus]|uniref:Uncharacterized protein n=1 Tax=Scophthalmus maximus TaxID=52904 RepID=A0A6A4TMW1_SCOMX|nr:hypothetical protein F2P81_001146 [Scophthalmus maximus]
MRRYTPGLYPFLFPSVISSLPQLPRPTPQRLQIQQPSSSGSTPSPLGGRYLYTQPVRVPPARIPSRLSKPSSDRYTHALTGLIGNENDPSANVFAGDREVNNGGSHIKTLRQKCNYCFSIDPNFQRGTHCRRGLDEKILEESEKRSDIVSGLFQMCPMSAAEVVSTRTNFVPCDEVQNKRLLCFRQRGMARE